MDRVFGGLDAGASGRLEDLPFLPVTLFKSHVLKSVPDESESLKVLTSSGTTGQQVSRIFVDGETARAQSAVLVKVAQQFIGKQRLPMVILDHAGVLKDRRSFSARAAGILGMAQFGHKPFYALREDMSLDEQGLRDYVAAADGKRILLFGFTYMVWAYFAQALERSGHSVDLSNGILIHSGGWKKLADMAVDAETFRVRLRQLTGLQSVLNFYGMVEQVGSVVLREPAPLPSCANLLRHHRPRSSDAEGAPGWGDGSPSGAELPACQLPRSLAAHRGSWRDTRVRCARARAQGALFRGDWPCAAFGAPRVQRHVPERTGW